MSEAVLFTGLALGNEHRAEDLATLNRVLHKRQVIFDVNGTAVLAEMFEQRGFDVITWRKLSPKPGGRTCPKCGKFAGAAQEIEKT